MTLKLATQLLAILLIVSLTSVMIISTILYVSHINSQKEQLTTVLKSISQIGSDNISKWLDERKTNVKTFAEAKTFTKHVINLSNPESSSQKKFQDKLQLQILFTDIHNTWYWLEGLKISDPDTGEMIFGFKDAPIKNLKEEQHFIDALNGNIAISEIYSSEEPIKNEFGEYEKDVPTLLISIPIYNDVGLEGILTARVNVFEIDSGVLEYVTDFHSGDAYMVNSNGVLLSRSAFPQDIVNLVDRRPELELRSIDPENQDLTELFKSADKHKAITLVDGYNDYRGIPVIGSINPIQDTNWFFIFEIDEVEAYQEFVVLQIIIGYSLVMMTIVIFVISSYFAQVFSRPIIFLKESAEKITRGNLDSPIKTKGAYEVLKLSESMEYMRQSIKKLLETERELDTAQQEIYSHEKLAEETKEFVAMIKQNLKSRTRELELAKKEKFETLGKLAANLAHDIKNPLASMKHSLEIIQRRAKDDEMSRKESERANRVIKRIEHQVDQVLNYVKTPPLLTKYTTVLTILKQTLDTITIPDNITIEIPEKDSEVKCDETQISVLFTNLIQNGIQAIGKDKGKISIRIVHKNDSIKIEIENTGQNIPEKDLDKIFEPLYTTKMEGTGLGLAACKNIIKSHKGTITVSNNPVKFTIEIPKSL